ncbi:hypothetical protein ACFWCF_12630 [Rhodococcus sp. NPDC060090]|uniref:hypothetical protein n=1 Tax=Rhodococcus sp. NPDC060090 TaxID=3347056 RepID=UPI0036636FAF
MTEDDCIFQKTAARSAEVSLPCRSLSGSRATPRLERWTSAALNDIQKAIARKPKGASVSMTAIADTQVTAQSFSETDSD